LLRELDAHAEAAAVEVRAELALLRLAPHRCDDATADADRAIVAAFGLGDVLLEDDVLTHRPERLQERRYRLRSLRDHRADALRALLELHDCGRSTDERERGV